VAFGIFVGEGEDEASPRRKANAMSFLALLCDAKWCTFMQRTRGACQNSGFWGVVMLKGKICKEQSNGNGFGRF
jgi:hypothetical protein